MKYIAMFFSILLISGIAMAQGVSTNYDYKKGDVIVGFNDNVSYEEAAELLKVYSLNYTNNTWINKILIVKVPKDKEEQWIKEFSSQSIVKYAELNYLAVIVSKEPDYTEFQEIENEFKTPEIAADNWMYGFKRFGESVTSLFTFDSSKKIILNYKLLKERLSELNDLADKGKDTTFFVEDVKKQLEDTNSSLKFSDSESVKNSSEFIRKASLVLQMVYQKVPENAKQAIENAINKTLEVKSKQDVKLGLYDDFSQGLLKEREKSKKDRENAENYLENKKSKKLNE